MPFIPGGASGKEPACQWRRHKRQGFDSWVRKIPWRGAWQPTPVFLPGESHGQRSLAATVHRVARSQTRLKRLSAEQKKPASETVWMEAGFLHPVPSLTTLVKLTSSNLTYCEETQQYLMHHLSWPLTARWWLLFYFWSAVTHPVVSVSHQASASVTSEHYLRPLAKPTQFLHYQ